MELIRISVFVWSFVLRPGSQQEGSVSPTVVRNLHWLLWGPSPVSLPIFLTNSAACNKKIVLQSSCPQTSSLRDWNARHTAAGCNTNGSASLGPYSFSAGTQGLKSSSWSPFGADMLTQGTLTPSKNFSPGKHVLGAEAGPFILLRRLIWAISSEQREALC